MPRPTGGEAGTNATAQWAAKLGMNLQSSTLKIDESGKPFVYRVRLYLGDKRLYVVEAGGTKEQMDRYAASVDWMLATVKL